MNTTIHEIGKRDIRQAQEIAWSAIGESGRAKFFEFRGRQSCIQKAQSKPLPGAAGKAFTSGPIKAAGKVVNRVVPCHFAILQALESPLLAMIENAMTQKRQEVDFKASEQWDVCYIFTEDAEAVYELLESEGVSSVRKAAKSTVATKWEAAAVNLVMLAVMEQVKRHIETTVRFAGEMEAQGEVSFFREQPESP
jgi:hypothetical protein